MRSPAIPFVFSVLAATLAGGIAQAEEFKLGENPVSVIMKWRPTTPDPEVQDFVKASRPAGELDYAPLSGPKIERPKLKSKDELKASVHALDAKAEALRRRGAATASADGGAVARRLQAAGAESRRRAAEDFEPR